MIIANKQTVALGKKVSFTEFIVESWHYYVLTVGAVNLSTMQGAIYE